MNTRQEAPLDEVMLAMDVVDTLRHERNLVARELDASRREAQLVERLRALYHEQGIDVPDHILIEGVKALDEARFTYTPPPENLQTRLARIYVSRGRWGKPALAIAAAVLIGLAGYVFAYRPYIAAQQEAARIELTETLPARIDAVYKAIYTDTKVQAALEEADPWVARGNAAVADGDREAARAAIAQLEEIHQRLLAEFSLRIVDREGENTGIWRFPEENSDATNYYIVVEAVGLEDQPVEMPIRNEETGATDVVSTWAVRVPETTYNAIRDDRLDDGIIQRNILGIKQYGFLDVEYTMPVLDGAITQW
ncbi:DUF6384 family protein [Pelagibacterium xiamenense]|uniref:DUF6384 family protein n=1 Tax=Pelagibacterium xiamenense TaxID=2901140 RepID=UPI001E453412|nr:DUF6384 family protein [Pelagibacterium xiamenense]MCD7058847.1 DUF6384 family protein [Pelagibacterium xiamenense]